MGKWVDEGFVTYKEAEYIDAVQKVFLEAFGDDFVLDKTTPQGILITRLAELFYNMDMDGVEVFSRLNINTATGIYLDVIGKLRGVKRITGSPQTATLKLTINPTNFIPFTIPSGTVFTDITTGDIFVTTEAHTIKTTEVSISAAFSENGDSSATIGDLAQVQGFGQITNIEITFLAPGAVTEDDISYRSRLNNAFPVATNTIEYVQNKIMALPYVKAVGHNYNDTAETIDGLSPYSTEWLAVPEAGTDIDNLFVPAIAEIILNNKMPGAPTSGNTTTTATDVFGTEKTVSFTIPDKIELEIDVRVTTPETTGKLDLSGVNSHITDIARYINSLNIGKDVSYSRCISPLVSDTGFDVQLFRIRKKGDSTWTENANYGIDSREYASITLADIKIGV